MTQTTLVSKDVAYKAKQVGFPQTWGMIYEKDSDNPKKVVRTMGCISDFKDRFISAPTQDELFLWLLVNKKYIAQVATHSITEFQPIIGTFIDGKSVRVRMARANHTFKTFPGARDYSLLLTLDCIIKQEKKKQEKEVENDNK